MPSLKELRAREEGSKISVRSRSCRPLLRREDVCVGKEEKQRPVLLGRRAESTSERLGEEGGRASEDGLDDVPASPSPASITNRSAPTVTVSSSSERNSRIFPAKGALTDTSICERGRREGRSARGQLSLSFIRSSLLRR